jgi:urea transporter
LLSTSKHGFDITETSGDGEHAATSGFFETLEKERRRSSIKQATPTSVTPPDVRGSETEKVNVVVDEEDDEIDIGEMDDETLDAVRGTFPIFFEDPIYPEANKQRTISFKSLLQSVDATMPWQYETLHLSLPKLIWMCLRGIGQVYFMNNPVTGFLILIGLLIQSTRVAVHGVIALVSGTAIALLLGFDTALARSGLFGYNAFLVGLAVATFDSTTKHLGYSVAIIICTIIFASFSSVVFVTLGKLLVPYKSPPLTLPFNLSTIFFLLASANMSRVDLGPVRTPALPDYESPSLEGISAEAFFAGTIRGIGQVFLADNIVTGALVLLGLAVCSRISAVTAYFGCTFLFKSSTFVFLSSESHKLH